MQRVRLLLPYLKEAGIDSEVLAVEPDSVSSPMDPWLIDGLPSDVPIHRVRGLGLAFRQIPGFGTLSNRAIGALKSRGNSLLNRERQPDRISIRGTTPAPFDLIYFSTTQFGIHRLGPYWKKRFSLPFVMDYQDPWVNDYYKTNPQVSPPGGHLKYGVASFLAKGSERKVLSDCSGVTSVSSDYPKQLRERYSFLANDWPVLVAPFPGDHRDIERIANDTSIKQQVFKPEDGNLHWVYVGRGGVDMHQALAGLFSAMADLKHHQPELLSRIKMHFVGTSYAASGSGTKTIEPLAERYGLASCVNEITDRLPYSVAMKCLLDGSALIVPGSNDPAYTASKIYPYLLAKKPMLAIFHERSGIVKLIKSVGGSVLATFNDQTPMEAIAREIKSRWLSNDHHRYQQPLNEAAFTPHTASCQAREFAKFFQNALDYRV